MLPTNKPHRNTLKRTLIVKPLVPPLVHKCDCEILGDLSARRRRLLNVMGLQLPNVQEQLIEPNWKTRPSSTVLNTRSFERLAEDLHDQARNCRNIRNSTRARPASTSSWATTKSHWSTTALKGVMPSWLALLASVLDPHKDFTISL